MSHFDIDFLVANTNSIPATKAQKHQISQNKSRGEVKIEKRNPGEAVFYAFLCLCFFVASFNILKVLSGIKIDMLICLSRCLCLNYKIEMLYLAIAQFAVRLRSLP